MYEALAAQMTRIIALMALTAPGLPGARRSTNRSTTSRSERYAALLYAGGAPRFGVADNGGVSSSLRARADPSAALWSARAWARTTAHGAMRYVMDGEYGCR